jgi:hypothetical protein
MKRSLTGGCCVLAVVISLTIGLASCGEEVALAPNAIELSVAGGGDSTYSLSWTNHSWASLMEHQDSLGPCGLYALLEAMDVQISNQFDKDRPNMSERHYLRACGSCGVGACPPPGTQLGYLMDHGVVDENCIGDDDPIPDTPSAPYASHPMCTRPYCYVGGQQGSRTSERWLVTQTDSFNMKLFTDNDIKAKLHDAPIVFEGADLVHYAGHKYVLMGYTEYGPDSTTYVLHDSWMHPDPFYGEQCNGEHTIGSGDLRANLYSTNTMGYQVTQVARQLWLHDDEWSNSYGTTPIGPRTWEPEEPPPSPPPPPLSVTIYGASTWPAYQVVTVQALVSGGTEPFHYEWTINGSPYQGCGDKNWCDRAMGPPYSANFFHVKVTDGGDPEQETGDSHLVTAVYP